MFLPLLFAVIGFSVNECLAQPIDESSVANAPFDAGQEIDQLLTQLVLDAIPHTFEDTKKWGLIEEKKTLPRLRRDPDGKIETHRPREMFNHGDWHKYAVALTNPAEQFSVQVKNIRSAPGGEMLFDVVCTSALTMTGRHAKWVRGVQLYSVGVDGKAEIELTLECQMKTSLDLKSFPPTLVFDPQVLDSHLDIKEFRIDHVGKVGGEVAQQVTRVARKTLDKKVAEKQESITSKLNQGIEKNREKLRVSTTRASKLPWAEQAKPHLAPEIQQSLK
jgi:hypothetical protein